MLVHSGANVTFPVMSVAAFSARKNTPQRTVCYRFTDGDRTVRTHSGWRGSVKNLAVLLPTLGVCPLPVRCLLFCFPVCPRSPPGAACPRQVSAPGTRLSEPLTPPKAMEPSEEQPPSP